MKASINNRKKKFLALLLSLMMVSSMSALAACKDDAVDSSSSSSSSETSNEEKDTGVITNAGFETYDDNKGLNPIGTSVTGWTRSLNSTTAGSALTSKAASGVIDTTKWEELTTSKVNVTDSMTEAEAKNAWDKMTVRDKLTYYSIWEKKDENDDKKIEKELDFYQSFNIDLDDLPALNAANPGVAPDSGEKDNNVLMIHNQYPEDKATGTAQKYTSSSTVTIKAGTSAWFSVWVKTSELQSATTDGEAQDAVGKGAYISVTHSVGGKSMDAFEVKNINTDEWTKYSFYLQGASYTDTTFNVVLGLGQGGGTDRLEYVNGYAFFDDIECELITNETFEKDAADAVKTVGFEASKEDKIVDASKADAGNKFALNFYGKFDELDFFASDVNATPTTEKSNKGVSYTAATVSGGDVKTYTGLGINTANDVTKVFTNIAEMNNSGNVFLQSAYDNYFKDSSFLANSKVLMLLSAEGAAYTANSTKTFTVNADKYLAISFYVKTSDMNGFTGAGITLNDGNNKTSISSIDTTTIDPVDIGDSEDIYEGWQQCLFFVSNETDSAKEFTLSFNFGSTTVIGTTKANYYAGFAAFTGFESYEMNEAEFDSATSGTYAKVVSLTSGEEKATGDSGFDSAASTPTGAIENGFAAPTNYKGVYSDSAFVSSGTNTEFNKNTNLEKLTTDYVAGLLNKEHQDTENYKTILKAIGGEGATWSNVFDDDTTQPLVIYSGAAQTKSYGFIGNATAIAANTYATVSMRVKVSDNAKAFVYLMDMDDDAHQKQLSIGRQVSYWYDADGNICSQDPSDEHFNAKKHTAFKLQSNGLYLVNPTWNKETNSNLDETKYYANLANYEVDAEGDLAIADGGVSYGYNDNWLHDGNDGKAFYAYNAETKMAYADSKKTTEVYDLSTVANLSPRYTAIGNQAGMSFEIGATNGEWATVTFYVHTGDTAKNYRLEIWSGSRDGETVNTAKGSYVLVDAYKPNDVDATSFANLVEARKDDIDTEDTNVYFENAFSFYDNAKYLRYDEKADVNGVGNSYDSYDATTYTAGTAFLKYVNDNVYELYADYALSEVTVSADVEEDDTTEEDDHDHDHAETNPWLLASSVAIAAVLVLTVASLIIQKALKKAKKNKAFAAKKEKKEKNK